MYIDNIVFDPAELGRVQERLALIANLKQKYGATLEQVLEYLHQAKQELEELENSAELVIKLKPRIAAAEKQYREDAALLTGLRREAAALLEKELQPVLVELALSGAKFVVQIDPREEPTSRGMDRVGFMFSANPGESVKPLAKIISGGETSRVMLALKTILAQQIGFPPNI